MMLRLRTGFISLWLVLMLVMSTSALSQVCASNDERYGFGFSGVIAGSQTFSYELNGKLTFSLRPANFGWEIRVFDESGMDLSQITPPYRSPNPREIFGWHFRNADNTATNTGDVNAPQQLRLFQFSASLSGTGGFRPPTTDTLIIDADSSDEGRGTFTIIDFGLSDLEPGQQARMTYLKFDVCLTWPKTVEDLSQESNLLSPDYLTEEWETMLSCGLDGEAYELSAWVMPRWLDGDVDGDGTIDHLTPVIRRSDGQKGIALCQNASTLLISGYAANAHEPLKTEAGEPENETYFSLSGYMDSTEYWELRSLTEGKSALILGRMEKAELAISWEDGLPVHQLLWVVVEP